MKYFCNKPVEPAELRKAVEWAYHNETTTIPDFSAVYISFPGFYNSFIDGDSEWEDKDNVCPPEFEEQHHSAEDESDYIEFAQDEFDWTEYMKRVSEEYAKIYAQELTDIVNRIPEKRSSPIEIKLDEIEVHSPREYNFCTDACMCRISMPNIRALYIAALSMRRDEDGNECGEGESGMTFPEYVKERLTPCPGFSPHFSPDLREWSLLPEEWDLPQTEILFDFLLPYGVVCSIDCIPNARGYDIDEKVHCIFTDGLPGYGQWLEHKAEIERELIEEETAKEK